MKILNSLRLISFVFVFQAVVYAQTPTPPPIVFKLRAKSCIGSYSGVPGSTDCTQTQATTNTGLDTFLSDSRKDASVSASVQPKPTRNTLHAEMESRINYLSASGPSFITSANSYLDVEVYVKDTETDTYSISIDGSSSHRENTRQPRSGGFGCPCGSQNALGMATSMPGLTLFGTASQLSNQVVTLPEFPGINYRLVYKRNVNGWDYQTTGSGGIGDWDFDAGLFAEASLSLDIVAAVCNQDLSKIELICRPLEGGFASVTDLGTRTFFQETYRKAGRHCYFLITRTDGTKFTIGAYFRNGMLAGGFNGDPITPPYGCIANDGDYAKSYCLDLTPSIPNLCIAFRALVDDVNRVEGVYNQKLNNSNGWVKRRLQEMGLSNPLPPTAPSNAEEYCRQAARAVGIMNNLERSLGVWGIEPCP
jgi:hypothetical protein